VSDHIELKVKAWYRAGSVPVNFPFFENPWEDFPIWIFGVGAYIFVGEAPRCMHTCQNYRPDIFFMSGPGQKRLQGFFQEGIALAFPAKDEPGANDIHLDIHIEHKSMPYGFIYTCIYGEREVVS